MDKGSGIVAQAISLRQIRAWYRDAMDDRMREWPSTGTPTDAVSRRQVWRRVNHRVAVWVMTDLASLVYEPNPADVDLWRRIGDHVNASVDAQMTRCRTAAAAPARCTSPVVPDYAAVQRAEVTR